MVLQQHHIDYEKMEAKLNNNIYNLEMEHYDLRTKLRDMNCAADVAQVAAVVVIVAGPRGSVTAGPATADKYKGFICSKCGILITLHPDWANVETISAEELLNV